MPVIAAVHGFCLGGGIGLVGNADVIVASRRRHASACPRWTGARSGRPPTCPGWCRSTRCGPCSTPRPPRPPPSCTRFGSVLRGGAARRAAGGGARGGRRDRGEGPGRDPGGQGVAQRHRPVDVKRSYRYEQGFTFELNLSGVADKVRDEFGRVTRDGPDWATPGRGGRFRAEARDWLRRQRARPAAALRRHPRGLRRATWSGSGSCSTPAGRWCRGREEYGGRDASLWEWLIFEEEYYRGRRPAAGHPERHLPAGARRCSSSARRSSRTPILPRMAAAEDLWCQGWSEPDAGSDLAGITQPGRARRRGRRLAADRPEDLDHPGRVLHPPVRAVPHRPRGRAAPRPDLLPRAARRARA